MDPIHKKWGDQVSPQKWAGLDGGQNWEPWRFDTRSKVQENFCYEKIFEKFKGKNSIQFQLDSEFDLQTLRTMSQFIQSIDDLRV